MLWLLILMAICAIPLIVSGSFGFCRKDPPLTAYKVDSIEEPEFAIQIPLTIAAGILATILLISLFRLLLLARAFKTLALFKRESTAAPQWLEYLLNRCASNANIKRKIQIRLSTKIQAPALAGFFKPVVLFPTKLLMRLHSEEIQQILLHEIAHLKRHDDWTILIQKFLSAIFFFNPAVVWISKRMDFEREIACDDSVVEAGGTPQSYALCLTRLAEFSMPLAGSPLLSASSQLSRRVDMLLNRSKKNSGMSPLSAIVILLLISAAVLWVSNSNPLLAVVDPDKKSKIVQAHATDRQVVQVNAEDYESASERMEQAQRKMEEAREEMLHAAEAMRHAGDGEDSSAEVMLHEEFDHESDTDHEAVVIRSEKVLRKVERDIQRETKSKTDPNRSRPC